MERKGNSLNIKRVWPYILFVASAAALLLRARLSFCWSDESFYFSTSNRFLQGDYIFVHEWFPTQLVSLILLPFHYLFKLINGGNDGVILYFRVLYVIFSLAAAITIYEILKKYYGSPVAAACGLFYQYYAHLNIATMSYYTLSYSFFLLSMLLIYDYVKSSDRHSKVFEKRPVRRIIAAGIIFALAVLSLPSLVVFYAAALILLILAAFIIKRAKWIIINLLAWMHVGIIIPAILVLIYVLPTSGLMGIIGNLEYVLSDEEHVVTSIGGPFRNFFDSVYAVFGKHLVLLAVLLFVIGLVYSYRSKIPFLTKLEKAVPSQIFIFSYFAANFVLFLYFLTKAAGYTGFAATVIVLFSLPLFAVMEKKDWYLFVMLVVNGMAFSMTYSYSSMCDLYVLSIGHNIAAIAGICFIGKYACDVNQARKNSRSFSAVCRAACALVIIISLIQTMTLRFINIYRDAPVSQLNTLITEGPARGLYTTPGHKEMYEGVLTAIRENEIPDGSVFFTKLLPWGYLATEMRCAAPTTWRTKIDSSRLDLYYDIHPEKRPDLVFQLNSDVGQYDTCGDVEADPSPNENAEASEASVISGYAEIRNPWMTIWKTRD